MKVSDFDYHLPEGLIAVRPAEPRDSARLLVVGEGFQDKNVRDLPSLLKSGDVLVFNDTKVIPARLLGMRGLAKVELLLHRRIDGATWEVFAKPAKRLRVGDVITFAPDFSADVVQREGMVTVRFNRADGELFAALEKHGHMPLPPYIKRDDDAKDRNDYQTMFAAREGAVAAPTASLHYTPELLEKLKAAGIEWVTVTLHVGAGTFLPVRVDDTDDHVMHAEWCEVSAEVAEKLKVAKAKGGRIIPVGTTALRTLESSGLNAFSGETRLFITPGYKFRAADALLTNFHLPKSTLFMLVAALCGLDTIKAAYQHAITSNYRFYSYGDTSLIFKFNE